MAETDLLNRFLGIISRYCSTIRSSGDLQRFQHRLHSNLPLSGCLSYAAFNLHVAISNGLPGCGPRLASTLLLHSHLGIGLHLYRSRRAPAVQRRILHTTYLTTLFNFGSILLVAVTKSYLPNGNFIRGIFALVASFGLISIGLDILALPGGNEEK